MPRQKDAQLDTLDLGVAQRQAFGVTYAKPEEHRQHAELVRRGRLRLPPHPTWDGDVTDWTADPFDDRNWQFQHHTLRWLNAVRWAALEGDGQAAALWRSVAGSWAKANVPAKRASSPFAWVDMADGNRAIQLSLGAPLVQEEDDWYVPLLRYHVTWLLDPSHLADKNHALHQHQGLLVAAATLQDRSALAVAHERMVEQFASTFDLQGANDEGAVGYHELNLKWWALAWQRVEAEGLEIPDSVSARLEAGGIALAHMVLPNGTLPQIGDTKRAPVAPGLGTHVDYVATGGAQGSPPEQTAVAYDRGYAISRSGWGHDRPLDQESHLLVRFGEDVRSHSHQDRGSVHIYTRGRIWLTDGGFFSYQTGDPTRNHFLSRQAHNVASLPEVPHEDRAEVALERFSVTETAHDILLRDHGYIDTDLTRRVIFLPGPECWIVWDEATDPMPIQQSWLVDVGVVARRHDRGFELRSGDRSVLMTWLGQTPAFRTHRAKEGDLHGWIATKWKAMRAGTLITATSQKSRMRSVALIGPSAPQEIALVSSYVTSAGLLAATVMRGPRLWSITVDGESITVDEVERDWT